MIDAVSILEAEAYLRAIYDKSEKYLYSETQEPNTDDTKMELSRDSYKIFYRRRCLSLRNHALFNL